MKRNVGCLFLGFLLAPTVWGQVFTPFGGEDYSLLIKGEMERYEALFRSTAAVEAADHQIDVTYYALDLRVATSPQYLWGKTTVKAVAVVPALQTMRLDLLNNMIVDSVRVGGMSVSVVQHPATIVITLDRPYAAGELITADIWYRGVPQTGGFGSFVFHSHSGGPWVWTLSQPYGARNWWPCKDHPMDKADSVDIRVTCDSTFKVGSNGVLVAVTNNGDGTSTHHWKSRYPISSYLVSIALTNYVQFSNWYHYGPNDSMEVLNYVLPQSLGSALANLPRTIDMLHIFSSLFGQYPFIAEKYGHAQFGWGGAMEHQTMTSTSSFGEYLVAHELAHQWFGDMITCRTWQDLWLNEGFATYSEALYAEHYYGTAAYWTRMNSAMASARNAVGTLFLADTVNLGAMFSGALVYSKGASVLHMLRKVLGDSTFFAALYNYANHPQLKYGTASTADFRAVCESTAGRDLSFFFNQWIYGERFPHYFFSWTAAPDSVGYVATVTIAQATGTTNPTFFTMPVDLKFVAGSWDTVFTVWNDANDQVFHIPLPHEPTSAFLDPDNWILKLATQVVVEEGTERPRAGEFRLFQNYPNPFNASTQIEFSLERAGETRLIVYDLLGRPITQLIDGYLPAGTHRIHLEATGFFSGVYFYRLTTSTGSITRRMVVIR